MTLLVAPRMPQRLLADLGLLLATIIWGSTFVMVKTAVASYPPFSFLALRFTLAAVALLPFVVFEARRAARVERLRAAAGEPPYRVSLWRRPAAPLLIGLASFAGFGLQTLGLQLTTPATAGFITTTYVVIVPLVTALLLRQAPQRNVWLGVALVMAGLALLSLRAGLGVGLGDLLVLGCAVAFAAHILLTGLFAPRYDPLLLTLGQIVVVAALSGMCAWLFELRSSGNASPPLTQDVFLAGAYTGVLATSAAFGIQMFAQRFTTSTHAALIFAGESVFAAITSFLLTGEVLAPRQLLGCALILGGMVVAEVKRQA